ncbi:DUF1642 domain-containing protein [Streptococcus pluranimalium]|uniref:DUF1642 domain-containing protein n=1 Tax=Streptococcus pluranimalium TaxID=82348 RepID=UPI003F68F615
MNKQEAIEYFKNKEKGYLIKPSQINVSTTEVIHIINQIDEPEKPVIPQFVADKIEYCKTKGYPIFHAFTISYGKTAKWLAIDGNDIVFAMAYGYGYTVEKPKLYTVEIPNPNGIKFCLAKKYDGIVISKAFGARWRGLSCYQLTEEEIRKDFEWAWQWAKPVED